MRAGFYSAIGGSKRNFVLGDYTRVEHIDSLATECCVNRSRGPGDTTLGTDTSVSAADRRIVAEASHAEAGYRRLDCGGSRHPLDANRPIGPMPMVPRKRLGPSTHCRGIPSMPHTCRTMTPPTHAIHYANLLSHIAHRQTHVATTSQHETNSFIFAPAPNSTLSDCRCPYRRSTKTCPARGRTTSSNGMCTASSPPPLKYRSMQ